MIPGKINWEDWVNSPNPRVGDDLSPRVYSLALARYFVIASGKYFSTPYQKARKIWDNFEATP